MGSLHSQHFSCEKSMSSLGTQHLTSLEDMNQLLLILFSLTPAVDSGVKQAQVFVGMGYFSW